MHFTSIELENVGPIDTLNFEFPVNDDGNPKPIIFVGENGSGKSIVLSHLVNLLVSAKQTIYDDAEVEKEKVFKIRSPHYIKVAKEYSRSKVKLSNDLFFSDWVLRKPKSDFNTPPSSDQEWNQIPHNETSHIVSNGTEANCREVFNKNTILYLPPNRFEEPAWLNSDSLTVKAEFQDLKRLSNYSNRLIFDYSPMKKNQNWLLDLLFDRAVFESNISPTRLPITVPGAAPNGGNAIFNQEFQIFNGHTGASSSLFNELLRGINTIIQKGNKLRFGVNPRHNRSISIIDENTNNHIVPNLFQLSTGESLLINLFFSILRDFDLANGKYSSLNEVSGVVIIDEVDMHLHTSFQKDVLPQLIKLFPKVQFIMTSHSPLFLLGLESHLGNDQFTIVNLPDGNIITPTLFSEFGDAYEAFKNTLEFNKDVEKAIQESQKPLLYVEGDYDTRYLKKAAELLEKVSILDQYEIKDCNGCSNLGKVWNAFNTENFSEVIEKTVVILYDCDVKAKDSEKNNKYKRSMPFIEENPIEKGVENLFPLSTIEKARDFKKALITKSISETRTGEESIKYNVHRDEKKNLCNWLCENGSIEDFQYFEDIFDLLDTILEGINGE